MQQKPTALPQKYISGVECDSVTRDRVTELQVGDREVLTSAAACMLPYSHTPLCTDHRAAVCRLYIWWLTSHETQLAPTQKYHHSCKQRNHLQLPLQILESRPDCNASRALDGVELLDPVRISRRRILSFPSTVPDEEGH